MKYSLGRLILLICHLSAQLRPHSRLLPSSTSSGALLVLVNWDSTSLIQPLKRSMDGSSGHGCKLPVFRQYGS